MPRLKIKPFKWPAKLRPSALKNLKGTTKKVLIPGLFVVMFLWVGYLIGDVFSNASSELRQERAYSAELRDRIDLRDQQIDDLRARIQQLEDRVPRVQVIILRSSTIREIVRNSTQPKTSDSNRKGSTSQPRPTCERRDGKCRTPRAASGARLRSR